MHGYGSSELASSFRTVRKNTVQIAEDIPEDKYDFVAAPGTMSVREVLRHIATSPMMHDDMHRASRVGTLKGYDFGALRKRVDAEGARLATKADIVASLKSNGEKTAAWFESLSPEFLAERFTDSTGENPRTRFESLLGVKEHEMHHRAQLMVLQRLMGIVPHLTRQREEMMRQRAAAKN